MPTAAFYDPGGMVDNFGMLTTDITNEKIYLTDAITWNKDKTQNFSYEYVVQKIVQFNNNFKFKYHVCERNNTGIPVIHQMRIRYRIPVIGINTTKNVTNPKTLQKGQAMDSNKIVEWINRFREQGIIEFPVRMTPGLMELKTELDNFGAKKHGESYKYQALTGHDDLVSCLKLAVHFAKAKFIRIGGSSGPFGAGIENIYHDESTRQERATEFAKGLMEKKGLAYDSLDVKFSW